MHMSNDNEQSYDNIATNWTSSRNQSTVHELVIQFSNLFKPGDSILDVGSGSGMPNAKYLEKKGFKITGIDISSKLVEEAIKNVPKGKFIKSDMIEFQTDEKYNGIIAWDSLFHLKINEHKEAFKKLYELLKNNGYLLFTHGGSEGEITGEMHGQKFSYSSLGPEKTRQLLEKLGFEIIKWELTEGKPNSEDKGYLIALVKKH